MPKYKLSKSKYTPRTNTDLFKEKPRTEQSLKRRKPCQVCEDRMRRALSLPTDAELKKMHEEHMEQESVQKDNPTIQR